MDQMLRIAVIREVLIEFKLVLLAKSLKIKADGVEVRVVVGIKRNAL